MGIAEPVDIYELHTEMTTFVPGPDTNSTLDQLVEWLARRDTYESALELFESGQWSEASQALLPLLPAHGDSGDVPSLTLASRSLDFMKSPPAEFDPTVNLASK